MTIIITVRNLSEKTEYQLWIKVYFGYVFFLFIKPLILNHNFITNQLKKLFFYKYKKKTVASCVECWSVNVNWLLKNSKRNVRTRKVKLFVYAINPPSPSKNNPHKKIRRQKI